MGAPTPAKRAPRAKATKATGPKVTCDLDGLSKGKAFPDLNIPDEPFTFLLNRVTYELGDPRDADWKMALQLSRNPFLLMRTMLTNADTEISDPTGEEIEACRERHGLSRDVPAPGSEAAALEAELWPDGVAPALIDRFTCAPLPGWKLEALFANWRGHYKIDLGDGQGILATLLGAS